jgi:hypothetical protein
VAECGSAGFDVAAGAGGEVIVLDTIRNVVKTFTEKSK